MAASTSNPTMVVTEQWSCNCDDEYEQKYQDERPEIGDDRKCSAHGKVTVELFWRRSRYGTAPR